MPELPTRTSALRGHVREFVRADPACASTSTIDSWGRNVDVPFSRRLANAGLIGLTWPRRYGGAARTHVDRLVVTEELLRAGAPVAGHWIGDRQIGPALLRYGSDELKDELLPLITRSEAIFCLGMSEPEAGSDLAAVTTRAERDASDAWILNGHKIWTSHAHDATHAYVLARTDPTAPKHQGLTEFLIDLDSPGVTIGPILDVAGKHHFNEVWFDEVRVPDRRVLGHVGDGWQQVIAQLSFERGGAERFLSTMPLLDAVVTRADIDDQDLGRLVAQLATLRWTAREVAQQMDLGHAPVTQSASLKLIGNLFEQTVADVAGCFAHDDSQLGDLAALSALIAPGFTIRGGAADVLMSIVSKTGEPR